MELEYYLDTINQIARERYFGLQEALKYVEEHINNQGTLMHQLITFREAIIVEEDKNIPGINAILGSAYFEDFSHKKRLAICCIVAEICGESMKYHYLKGFENYNEQQTIFKDEPSLFKELREKEGNIDYELVKCTSLNIIYPGFNWMIYNGKYYEVDGHLPPKLLGHLWDVNNRDKIFVRINPNSVYTKETFPGLRLNEEELISPNPNWIRSLHIYNGKKEGCSFFLDDYDEHYLLDNKGDSVAKQKYLDRYFKKIKRLDIIAKRGNDGNLSMMLEELSFEMEDHGLLLGRCIHLDTDYRIGSSFEEARLNHLDCAINVYSGKSIKQRLEENLAHGEKVSKASPRIHLIRIDDIPFVELLNVALMFFRSTTLTREWIDSQFKQK